MLYFRLPYASYFGGVSALTREQYETINGFSNEFFGWGGEDDDFYNRFMFLLPTTKWSSAIEEINTCTHVKRSFSHKLI